MSAAESASGLPVDPMSTTASRRVSGQPPNANANMSDTPTKLGRMDTSVPTDAAGSPQCARPRRFVKIAAVRSVLTP